MPWCFPPKVPEDGSHIFVEFKRGEGKIIEIFFRCDLALKDIKKWCYYDSYINCLEKKLEK